MIYDNKDSFLYTVHKTERNVDQARKIGADIF